MNRHARPTLALTLGLWATNTLAQGSQWTICTQDLRLINAIVLEANQDRILTIDPLGLRSPIPLDSIFFAYQNPDSPPTFTANILTDDDSSSRPTDRSIRLIDNQILFAEILDNADPDTLRFNILTGSTTRGTCSLPIDQLLSIHTPEELQSSNQPPADDDILTTTNNDRFVGFIESVGPLTSIDTNNQLITLPMEHIKSINLANPAQPAIGTMLITNQGTRVLSKSFETDFQRQTKIEVLGSSLGLDSSASTTWLMPPDLLIGIEINHPSQHIVALSDLAARSITPTGHRDWTPAPAIIDNPTNPILSTIDLRAPISVVYDLPAGTTRFACTLIAPINTWTDCLATITIISDLGTQTQLIHTRLHADHPEQIVNTPITSDARQIEIRIDPGEHGPIQDRVLVQSPRLLIES
ncbi:MAG: hypothetical protein ACWA5W_10135 [Phycisphaerales bacterium]